MNDTCINECAIILYELYHHPLSAPVSTFSSYVFTHLTDTAGLQRSTKPALYWERDLWLIPRHRHWHWTLVIVVVSTRTIMTFDSFGDHNSWEQDTNVSHSAQSVSRD